MAGGKEYQIAIKIAGKLDKSLMTALGKASSAVASAAAGSVKIAAAAYGGMAAGIAAFGASSVKAGAEFDTAMSQVAATMGKTVDEIGDLRQTAIDMGSTTKFTATEAAEALNYMALAGYDSKTAIGMLPNVLNLAAAGNFDLARASDMVTDTQTAFGISLERTRLMVDEMAKAASTGNTSVEQLGDAFLVVGGLAQEMSGGMITLSDGTTATVDNVQELEIALTAMANAGIKGGEAGTHMRNMLLKLASPTAEGTKALKALGVSVYNSEGAMRSLSDIFGDLNGKFATMTQQQKLDAISALFNTRDIATAEALLAAVGEDWDQIGEAILNADGAAEQMAKTQLDNLAGDVTYLKSAFNGLQIAISDRLNPALRSLAQFGTASINRIMAAFQSGGLTSMATTIGNVLADSSTGAASYASKFIDIVSGITNGLFDGLMAGAPKVGAAAAEIATNLLNSFTTFYGRFWETGSTLFAEFLGGMVQNAPQILATAKTAITNLASALKANAPLIVNAVTELIPMLLDAVTDMAPVLLNLGITLAKEIGNGLIKAAPTIAAKIPELLSSIWGSLKEEVGGGGAALIAGLFGAKAIGGIASVFSKISRAVKDGAAVFGALGKTIKGLGPVFGNIFGVIGKVGKAFLSLSPTVLIVIAAIAALIAIGVLVYKNWDKIKDWLINTWNAIKDGAVNIWNSIKNFISSTWEAMKEKVTTVATAIKDAVSTAWTNIVTKTKEIWENAKQVVTDKINAIKAAVQTGFEAARSAVSTAMEAVKTKVTTIWTNVRSAFATATDAVKSATQSAFTSVQTFIASAMDAAKAKIDTAWTNIKSAFSTATAAVKSAAQTAFSAIQTAVSTAMESVKSNVSSIWTNVKSTFSTATAAVKGAAQTAFSGIQSAIATAMDAAKSNVDTAWTGIKSAFSTATANVKSVASTAFSSVQTAVTTAMNAAKGVVSTAASGIQSAISTAFNAAKSTASSVFSAIQSAVSDNINAAKNTVSTAVTNIKNSMNFSWNLPAIGTTVLDTAKTAVSNAVSYIEGLFNFSWSLPSIKTPHFYISSYTKVLGVSIPSIGVSWYKKGGILDGAQIFGQMGDKLLGGGEAGKEAVLPLSELWKNMRSIMTELLEKNTAQGSSGIAQALHTLTERMADRESARGTTPLREILAGLFQQNQPALAGGPSSSWQISFSPVYNFNGEAAPTKEEIVEANRISEEEFEDRMEEWLRNHDRRDF